MRVLVLTTPAHPAPRPVQARAPGRARNIMESILQQMLFPARGHEPNAQSIPALLCRRRGCSAGEKGPPVAAPVGSLCGLQPLGHTIANSMHHAALCCCSRILYEHGQRCQHPCVPFANSVVNRSSTGIKQSTRARLITQGLSRHAGLQAATNNQIHRRSGRNACSSQGLLAAFGVWIHAVSISQRQCDLVNDCLIARRTLET
jgi:hypothetical protein